MDEAKAGAESAAAAAVKLRENMSAKSEIDDNSEALDKFIKKIKEEIDVQDQQMKGMTAGQIAIAKMEKAGVDPAKIQEAKDLNTFKEQNEANLKHAADMRTSGKSIFEATRTPLEKLQKQMKDIDEMSTNIDENTKKPFLSEEAANRAKNTLLKEFQSTIPAMDTRHAGIAEIGSQAEHTAMLDNERQKPDAMLDLKKVNDQQLTEQEKITYWTRLSYEKTSLPSLVQF
jgi:ribosomal protein S20